MKKQLLLAGSVAAIGLSTLGVVGFASAATNSSNKTSSSIVDKLVAKFGLKKADVQAVFDEQRTAHEAERLQNISDKLAAGVKAGTITQDQSDKILAKVKELQAKREANHAKMETMTKDERKAAMEAERTALKAWISDNKIPDAFAHFLRMGGGHGMGGHGMMDSDKDGTPDSNSN